MSLTHRGSFDLSVKTADKLSLATNSGVGNPWLWSHVQTTFHLYIAAPYGACCRHLLLLLFLFL